MAWRISLPAVPQRRRAEGGEERDDDLRELQFLKNQYGPRGETIVLRYQRGLFLPDGGIANLDTPERTAIAEGAFLDLLRRFTGQNRNVSEKKNANNYAPAAFVKEDEAKKHRLKKADLEEAMRQLFKADKIHNEAYGRPAQLSSKIRLGPAASCTP